MFVFQCERLSAFQWAIARKNDSQYWFVLATPPGLIYDRKVAHLNYSTPSEPHPPPLSLKGRPYFWFDSSWDRGVTAGPPLLSTLLSAEPRPPLRLTGSTQKMSIEGTLGGDREAVEVELLLSEDELCHVCYYCGKFEDMWEARDHYYTRNGGKGYMSTYSCGSVSKQLDNISIFSSDPCSAQSLG